MHLDPKMSIEEIAKQADEMLKSIGNNLTKFLELETNSESATNKNSFYNTGTATSISDKRKHFAENLELVKEGCKELNEVAQEHLNSKLVSPAKHSP